MLARLADGREDALRRDFRRIYRIGFDEVDAAEAVCLIRGLPAGTEYVSAACPARSWTPEREALADVQDTIWRAAATLLGSEDAPRVTRPRDVEARRAAAARVRSVRERIEGTAWKEVL